MKKIFYPIVFILLAANFVVLGFLLQEVSIFLENKKSQMASLEEVRSESPETEPKSQEITLFLVGDIMLDRGVEYQIKKHQDFQWPFLKIAGDFKKADLVFGNLEGPISDKGIKVGSLYSFRADPKVIEGLTFAGFDILSLANNHMFDYQRIALEDTMRVFRENDIDFVGAGLNQEEAFSLKIRESKNTKIGFLAYTNLGPESWRAGENNPGIAWIQTEDIEKIKKDIQQAKEKADVLIVSLHSGEEYAINPSSFQISFATTSIAAGADLVVGHHPHVVQKIEKFGDGWVAYSLGNFVFDQGFSEETMKGLLLEVKIKDGKINQVHPKEIKISDSFQPYLVENEAIQKEPLKDLSTTRANFISEELSFLEVDLSEMKVKIYEKGELLKELPIFTRGNPARWGGTSLGVYKVLSKHKLAFSFLAQSYMPWSVHIYGKYYIHGDNWYSGGRLDTSPITGGCIRLSDENAQIVFNFTKEKMPVLVTDKGFENDDFKYSLLKNPTQFPEILAKNYLVVDLGSGFIFKEKDFQEQVPIASLTKLMTAVIISEFVDLRKSILVKSEMLQTAGQTEGLIAGKSFKTVELLYPLLIESSNDAAEVLSRFLGREETIRLMNEKTKSILMEKTKFVDPAGLSNNNLSTTEDLFHLAKYILISRPTLLKISKQEDVWTFDIPISFKKLENKNVFFNDENFLGGKTGYSRIAGYTGVFIFKITIEGTERKIAIILLGSTDLEKDAKEILNWLKENY